MTAKCTKNVLSWVYPSSAHQRPMYDLDWYGMMHSTFVFLCASSSVFLYLLNHFPNICMCLNPTFGQHKMKNPQSDKSVTNDLLAHDFLTTCPSMVIFVSIDSPMPINKSPLLAPVPSWTATCALLQSARNDLEAGPAGSRALLKGSNASAISLLHLLWSYGCIRYVYIIHMSTICPFASLQMHCIPFLPRKSLSTKRAPQMDLERQLQSPVTALCGVVSTTTTALGVSRPWRSASKSRVGNCCTISTPCSRCFLVGQIKQRARGDTWGIPEVCDRRQLGSWKATFWLNFQPASTCSSTPKSRPLNRVLWVLLVVAIQSGACCTTLQNMRAWQHDIARCTE